MMATTVMVMPSTAVLTSPALPNMLCADARVGRNMLALTPLTHTLGPTSSRNVSVKSVSATESRMESGYSQILSSEKRRALSWPDGMCVTIRFPVLGRPSARPARFAFADEKKSC